MNKALKYAKKLQERNKEKGQVSPLDRLEPNTVMVDFIRYITKNEKEIDSNLYLGKDSNDGDDSDNGNFCIDLKTGLIKE